MLPHLTNQRNVSVSSSTASIYVYLKLDHLNWWVFFKIVCSEFFTITFFLLDHEVCKCFSGFSLISLSTLRIHISTREQIFRPTCQADLPSTSLFWTVSLRATPMARELTLECVAHQNKRNSLCSFQVKLCQTA